MKRPLITITNFATLKIVIALSLFFGAACSNTQTKTVLSGIEKPSPVNTLATDKTKALYANLIYFSKDKILFGHQDDLAYGVNWEYEEGRSDTKETSGSYPAVFGWDIGGISLGIDKNLDSVPFERMKIFVRKAYEYGGINTISWHTFNPVTNNGSWVENITLQDSTVSKILPGAAYHEAYVKMLDKVADFMLDLKDAEGNLIPIFFRPFHENNGDWFWWGSLHCTPEQYKMLYNFTATYLIEKRKVHNLLFIYSPDRNFETTEQYLDRYPGDNVVDVIAFDDYHSFKIEDTQGIIKRLQIVTDLAEEKNKLATFSETGFEGIKNAKAFTETLLPLINHDDKTRRIAWVLVWRNANSKHHYVPFNGHPAAEDFSNFRDHEVILFGDDIPNLYRIAE